MNASKSTILFPTDYSACSRAALKKAIELARATHARLLAAYVAPPDVGYEGIPPSSADQGNPQDGFRLQSLVESLMGDAPVEYEHRMLVGDPVSEILELAKRESASLIVMGTTGRTGLRRLLLGSVAEEVVRRASCPVLTLSQTAAGPAAELNDAAAKAESASPHVEREAKKEQVEAAPQPLNPAIDLVTRAATARATDIHIDPAGDEYEVRFRIDGRLRHACRLSKHVGHSLLTQFKILGNLDIADPFHGQEGRLRLPAALASYEVRIAAMPVVGGEAVSLRLLDRHRLLRPVAELGLSAGSL